MYEEGVSKMMKEMVKIIQNWKKDIDMIISIKNGNNQLTENIKNDLNTVASNLQNTEGILDKLSK